MVAVVTNISLLSKKYDRLKFVAMKFLCQTNNSTLFTLNLQ